MRISTLGLLMLLATPLAYAQEYGHYDLKQVWSSSDKTNSVSLEKLDQILRDLSMHAINYPPKFDTATDQERAIKDVTALSDRLDIEISLPLPPDPELLMRAGLLNTIGHNLDIRGCALKANSIFQILLTISPDLPRGNYMYGNFLGGVGKAKEAIPYLEKAASAGITDATYSLGMSYLFLGNKQKALEYFAFYKQHTPSDKNVDRIIEAIRNDTLKLHESSAR